VNTPSALPGLDRDLSVASNEQLLRVVGLIDTLDRRGPMDRLLDPVRDRLALLRPPRPLALGRVLILPFEDLLVPDGEVWPGRRCLSRAHLGMLIELVTADLPAATASALKARATGQTMMSGDVVKEIGTTLWPAAAAIITSLVERASEYPERDRQLAGVAPLLALGAAVVPTIWQLPPRPITSLPRPALELVLDLLRAALPLGAEAVLALLELLLARTASPMVVLDPLRGADFGLPPRERDALLGQLVHRRIADMGETTMRLATPAASGARADAAGILRLAADLEALEGNWPVSPGDKAALAAIRRSVSTFVGSGIETVVRHEILSQLTTLAQPDGMSDDGIERLEETARHTRRLGIAGAKLGLAATPDSLLKPFLQSFQDAVRARCQSGGQRPAGLLEQVRVVEILFGADAAMRLYDEMRGRRGAAGGR
jgi:hypothetical protein